MSPTYRRRCAFFRKTAERTAETVSADVWNGIAEFAGVHEESAVPQSAKWEDHVSAAQEMRDFLDSECNKTVCGVCSMLRRAVDIKSLAFGDIPNVDLLLKDGPTSPEHPRDGLTTVEHNGDVYCLQPAACTPNCTGDYDVALCKSCRGHLEHKRIPPESLVCFDAGMSSKCMLDIAYMFIIVYNVVYAKHSIIHLVYLL